MISIPNVLEIRMHFESIIDTLENSHVCAFVSTDEIDFSWILPNNTLFSWFASLLYLSYLVSSTKKCEKSLPNTNMVVIKDNVCCTTSNVWGNIIFRWNDTFVCVEMMMIFIACLLSYTHSFVFRVHWCERKKK